MIQKIEELSMNAFPALSTMLVNGWVVRFGKGYSRRANSVNIIYPCSVEVRDNISLCEEMYKAQNLNTVFKLTERKQDFDMDVLLEGLGYGYEAKTNIMLKNIKNAEIDEETNTQVVIYREFREDWLKAYMTMNNANPEHFTTIEKIIRSIQPQTYYACIIEDGVISAVGLGVGEQKYVGMFDICVDKEKRRRGLGEKIMKKLIYEAAKDGYEYSYLQVVDDNEPAKKLYEKLGYKKQYSYWYRVKKSR